MDIIKAKPDQLSNIVLFHGGPGSPGNMPTLQKQLAKNNPCLIVEQRKDSIHELLQDIHLQIDFFSSEEVVIIGHSWGAWLSAIYAATYPKKVKKLIQIGCGPLEQKYLEEIHRRRISRLDPAQQESYLSSIGNLGSYDILRSKLALQTLKHLTDTSDHFEVQTKFDFSPPVDIQHFKVLSKEISGLRKSGALVNYYKEINCPILFLHGNYDPHPIEGITEPLSAAKVSYKMIPIKKCGHEPWMERKAAPKFYEKLNAELK